jgi:segregation and condensation protein A
VSFAEQSSFDFAAAQDAAEAGSGLIVDLDGYEGPLHVLLALARSQKVDLLQLSIADLADQYLVFVQEARRANFTLAADYLVMAAWLAYLKSRLLLPREETARDDGRSAEEDARDLAFRLLKLDAMRRAAETLQTCCILKREVFPRGDPEAIQIRSDRPFEGDLYALIQAYVAQRTKEPVKTYHPRPPEAYSLEDARRRLRGKLSDLGVWTALAAVAPFAQVSGPSRASYVASTLAAGLELVREGVMEARQLEAFADIYLRARFRLETDH